MARDEAMRKMSGFTHVPRSMAMWGRDEAFLIEDMKNVVDSGILSHRGTN